MSKMNDTVQKFLLALGILALLFLLVEIGASLAATQHGSTPARVDHVTAGPYRFTVSLYDDPDRAGFALPFAIAPQGAASGSWAYQVTSVPKGTLLPNGRILIYGQYTANPIKDSVSPDPQVPGGVQGAAEISVQGPWICTWWSMVLTAGRRSMWRSRQPLYPRSRPGWAGRLALFRSMESQCSS
jgi:hypothetical protein